MRLMSLTLTQCTCTGHLLPGSSMRSANHAAPSGSCARPMEDGLANCKNQTSPNFLILLEIEMERLLNTQKWDTKCLLPKFTKGTYNTTKRTVNGRSRIQFTQLSYTKVSCINRLTSSSPYFSINRRGRLRRKGSEHP